jgi:hypothetical protein
MKKILFASASLALLSAQATAQVRPQDCRPVFPVVDQVAEVVPPPAVVPPPPVATHGFNYAWLLIPGVFLTGLLIATHHHDNHHHETVSPA